IGLPPHDPVFDTYSVAAFADAATQIANASANPETIPLPNLVFTKCPPSDCCFVPSDLTRNLPSDNGSHRLTGMLIAQSYAVNQAVEYIHPCLQQSNPYVKGARPEIIHCFAMARGR